MCFSNTLGSIWIHFILLTRSFAISSQNRVSSQLFSDWWSLAIYIHQSRIFQCVFSASNLRLYLPISMITNYVKSLNTVVELLYLDVSSLFLWLRAVCNISVSFGTLSRVAQFLMTLWISFCIPLSMITKYWGGLLYAFAHLGKTSEEIWF